MNEGIIIHLMEKEGIIRELSYLDQEERSIVDSEKHNSFLTELISSAEAVALVHDLDISWIQFKLFSHIFFPKNSSNNSCEKTDSQNIQVVFDRQPDDSMLLNASAIIWGSKEFDLIGYNILKTVVKFYTGMYLRKKNIQNFSYYRKKFDKRIMNLASSYLDSPEILNSSKSIEKTEPDLMYGCTGIYKFQGTVIEHYYCENGHLSEEFATHCSICGEQNHKQPYYRVEDMSFASLASQLKASDSLKYVFQWLKIGERIIQTFIRQKILSEPIKFVDLMLIPQKIFFKEKSSYGVSLWHFENSTLNVAILSDTPFISSKEIRKKLNEHQKIIEERNWNFSKLKAFYGLNSVFEKQSLINEKGKLNTSVLLDLDYNL